MTGLEDPAFAAAVKTAREHLPIIRMVSRPECCSGFTIVRKASGRLAVVRSDAWQRPSETPLLPWRPPTGTPLATVDMDGQVKILDEVTRN